MFSLAGKCLKTMEARSSRRARFLSRSAAFTRFLSLARPSAGLWFWLRPRSLLFTPEWFSLFFPEEEDDDDDEEEEEIDVVTVDRRKSSRRSHTSPLVLKRSHVNIHQHNYAAQQPPEKRAKAESSSAAPRQSGGRRCWSPKSEGEDNDKRRTHNVLERQRRNELKMSFMVLRDEVPAVANNEKAAKVVILKKAAEFIMEVREQERKLLAKKDELRKRSRELKQRLQQLRTSP